MGFTVVSSFEKYMRYWQVRVNRMRNETMAARPYKLWGFIQKFWELSDAQMIQYFGERPANLNPN